MARVQFEDLQELWQNQPQSTAGAVVDAQGITGALRAFGRRQKLVFSVKVAAFLWQTWCVFTRLGITLLTVGGEAVFVAGIATFMVADWRNQMGIARLDFTKPSAGFVDSTLARLRDPNAPFRGWFWVNLVLVGIGANLLLASRWAASTPQQRLLSHATATAAPFACWAVALTIRTKRYELEYRPLVKQLTAMKQALEEQLQ